MPDTATMQQVAALPAASLDAYANVLTLLELDPWKGRPQHENNPGAAVRRWIFGPGSAGQVVYLIVEQQQEVHVLLVQWLG